MLIQKQLIGNTNLMVGMLETQLVKCLFIGVYSREIEVDCVKNLVIGNTTFYNIV